MTQLLQVPPRTGDVLFPLASNARSLVAGAAVESVRARIKISSLLYDRVLLEGGQLTIQSGPNGSVVFRNPPGTGAAQGWQTPYGRNRARAVPISLAAARELVPGVPPPGPYHEVLHSDTTFCWLPTFEPFASELPSDCDWIVFGRPGPVAPEMQRLADRWKRHDARNSVLERLEPDYFVRSLLIDHVSQDLTTGVAGGWDISLDRYHGDVVNARFSDSKAVESRAFALPILIPKVGNLSWAEVAAIRHHPAIERMRKVLHEVEAEAAQAATGNGDIESAVQGAYNGKVQAALSHVENLGSSVRHVLAELLVGTGAGYSTFALGLAGPVAAGTIGATVMAGFHVHEIRHYRRRTAWLGVMNAISTAASGT